MPTEHDTRAPNADSGWGLLLFWPAVAASMVVAFCWFVVPWSPTDCRLGVASLGTAGGARYEVTQSFWTLNLYSPRFFYRRSDKDDWLGYWMGKEELYLRATLKIDGQTGHIQIVSWGEIIGVFDPVHQTLWLRAGGTKHGEPIEVIHELETCP